MELSAHAKLLASIPMFSSIPQEDIEDLSATLTVRDLQKGDDVFRQGDKGAKLYVIQEGEVEISVGEKERKVVLTNLHKGQYFGEMSIMDGSPRSATATATRAASLLELDRKQFVEFLKRRPLSSIYIMAELGDRMRATNELMTRQLTKSATDTSGKAPGALDAISTAFGSATVTIVAIALMTLSLLPTVSTYAAPELLGTTAARTVAASLVLLGGGLAFAMTALILSGQQRLADRIKALAESSYRVNLKNEVSIEAILRKEGEILARTALIERRLGLDFDAPPPK